MTDTFAYNPPALNSASSFPLPNESYPLAYTNALSLNHTQRLESYRAAHANQPEPYVEQPQRTEEIVDERKRLSVRRMTDHGLPEPSYKPEQYARGASISPKPQQMNYAPNYQQPSANIRNTRPMTAPSSVSAPYYYSATPQHSFYPPPSTLPPLYPYQNQQIVNGADALQHYRTSLMQTGVPGGSRGIPGLQDQSGYSNGRETMHDIHDSTFLHAPPPLPRPAPPYYDTPTRASTDENTPEQRSRPATAESRPNSARPNLDQNYAHPFRSTDDSAYIPTADDEPTGGRSRGFVAGKANKRPRRRYDEIERLYTCDYPGCPKAYGTLNHLNSHKTMQKHGPKSTPARSSFILLPLVDALLTRTRVQSSRSFVKHGGRARRLQQLSHNHRPPSNPSLLPRSLPLLPPCVDPSPLPLTSPTNHRISTLPSSPPLHTLRRRIFRISTRSTAVSRRPGTAASYRMATTTLTNSHRLHIVPSPHHRTSTTRQCSDSVRLDRINS